MITYELLINYRIIFILIKLKDKHNYEDLK
jgi:hypothetical protein